MASVPGKQRDLRLDFFRGLALLFIFLNHIPDNIASWATTRFVGFSDATEIFVFISGYSALLAYGGAMRRQGFALAAAGVLRRCWQIYIAHIVLFVLFVAQIAYVAQRFENPMFVEEMNILGLFEEPHMVMLQALLLRFRPVNMDVLPLYILLLLAFPAVLWAMRRAAHAALLASALLYAAARTFGWTLSAYPEGEWYFNPFAWQFLFVFGAWCASQPAGAPAPWHRLPARLFLPLAVAYLLFGVWIVLTWSFPPLAATVPDWLGRVIYPVNKTDLDLLRLLHFWAMAYLTVRLVPPEAPFLRAPLLRPVLRCGQQSLHVFCLGIFLAFAAHFLLVELDGSVATQLAVSASGIALMLGAAAVITWYKRGQARPALQPAPAE